MQTPPFLAPFYPILDSGSLQMRGIRVACFAGELARAGVALLQYRDKAGAPAEILRCAQTIAGVFRGSGALLLLNDRADLASLAGWAGVHVGQEDLSPCAVREVFGGNQRIVGVSTHTEEQVVAADAGCADYIAIGPVFATGSKADAEPAVGLQGVRRARALTRKPLVAIGGITRANARAVMEAGADSVAVIGELLHAGERPGRIAEDFLELLR